MLPTKEHAVNRYLADSTPYTDYVIDIARRAVNAGRAVKRYNTTLNTGADHRARMSAYRARERHARRMGEYTATLIVFLGSVQRAVECIAFVAASEPTAREYREAKGH